MQYSDVHQSLIILLMHLKHFCCISQQIFSNKQMIFNIRSELVSVVNIKSKYNKVNSK